MNSKLISRLITSSKNKRYLLNILTDANLDKQLYINLKKILNNLKNDNTLWDFQLALSYFSKLISPSCYLEISKRSDVLIYPTIQLGDIKLVVSKLNYYESSNHLDQISKHLKSLKCFLQNKLLLTFLCAVV